MGMNATIATTLLMVITSLPTHSDGFVKRNVGNVCFQVPIDSLVGIDERSVPPELPPSRGFAFEIPNAKLASLASEFIAQTDIHGKEIPMVGNVFEGSWSAYPADDDPFLAEALSDTAIVEVNSVERLLYVYNDRDRQHLVIWRVPSNYPAAVDSLRNHGEIVASCLQLGPPRITCDRISRFDGLLVSYSFDLGNVRILNRLDSSVSKVLDEWRCPKR
jgi:hypothetical protein